MPRLTDISAVRQQLERNGIILQKSMGQNFLVNPSVCPRMAELSGIDDESGVIEIGPGIGVLTVELAKLAKRVIAIELDERLKPVLAENLAQFDNTQVIWGDAMKLDLHKIIKENFSDCKKVCVCANLP
ncbi:MAG: 16S rRNA (adenine(1518)-N(6)/adenine(1519)-N(6))-dimethyltransferase, partial [Clostridia bacterium]|nr:16S rRNA (adenine(1518)-N(6)/adenine(1519)-N(6))-dimethyltransferase [Clostridia bacterium]